MSQAEVGRSSVALVIAALAAAVREDVVRDDRRGRGDVERVPDARPVRGGVLRGDRRGDARRAGGGAEPERAGEVVQEEDRDLPGGDLRVRDGRVLDRLAGPGGEDGEGRRVEGHAVEVDREGDGRGPRVGDEGREAPAVAAEDDVGDDDVVLAADVALVVDGGGAGVDAGAVRPAGLVRRAGADDLAVAVDERVQIVRAVGAGAARAAADARARDRQAAAAAAGGARAAAGPGRDLVPGRAAPRGVQDDGQDEDETQRDKQALHVRLQAPSRPGSPC